MSVAWEGSVIGTGESAFSARRPPAASASIVGVAPKLAP